MFETSRSREQRYAAQLQQACYAEDDYFVALVDTGNSQCLKTLTSHMH